MESEIAVALLKHEHPGHNQKTYDFERGKDDADEAPGKREENVSLNKALAIELEKDVLLRRIKTLLQVFTVIFCLSLGLLSIAFIQIFINESEH